LKTFGGARKGGRLLLKGSTTFFSLHPRKRKKRTRNKKNNVIHFAMGKPNGGGWRWRTK